MLNSSKAFHGFSVDDGDAAKTFYGETLGLDIEDGPMGLTLKVGGGNPTFIYPKKDHTPASFTILNFPVDDIDQAVKELTAKGVSFEQYEGMTDEKGVMRGIEKKMGPNIAWFKDPAGNILSILQDA